MKLAAKRDPGAIAQMAMTWMDQFWDPSTKLLRPLEFSAAAQTERRTVRETGLYALGLLRRGHDGDHDRARAAIGAVLAQQYVLPKLDAHGTWARSPDESIPGAGCRLWVDYDPNWREFVGTNLAIMQMEFGQILGRDICNGIDKALHHAVEGALARKLDPHYTNIALMHAALLGFYGIRTEKSAYIEIADQYARDVVAIFDEHGAFDEYNSPTYYGVDFYGLGLWRKYGPTECMRREGVRLEAALWRDVARYYHAGLKNICGPHDRTYGMDMTRYVALVGIPIAMIAGIDSGPLPDVANPFEHSHDLATALSFDALDAVAPEDVKTDLTHFRGEREVTQLIDGQRVATAWLNHDVMFGGQAGGTTRPWAGQFAPATAHWRQPDGQIGWLRLSGHHVVDATASRGKMVLRGGKPRDPETLPGLRLDYHAAGEVCISERQWIFPGLKLNVACHSPVTQVRESSAEYIWISGESGYDVELMLSIAD